MSGLAQAEAANPTNPTSRQEGSAWPLLPAGAPPTAGQRLRPRCAPGFAAVQRRLQCDAMHSLAPPGRAPGAAGRHGGGLAGGIIVTARKIDGPGAGLAARWGTLPCPRSAFLPAPPSRGPRADSIACTK
jgi:hypothetical protein